MRKIIEYAYMIIRYDNISVLRLPFLFIPPVPGLFEHVGGKTIIWKSFENIAYSVIRDPTMKGFFYEIFFNCVLFPTEYLELILIKVARIIIPEASLVILLSYCDYITNIVFRYLFHITILPMLLQPYSCCLLRFQ